MIKIKVNKYNKNPKKLEKNLEKQLKPTDTRFKKWISLLVK
jgi:hypothetical protein